jgi:hypothetical protein
VLSETLWQVLSETLRSEKIQKRGFRVQASGFRPGSYAGSGRSLLGALSAYYRGFPLSRE